MRKVQRDGPALPVVLGLANSKGNVRDEIRSIDLADIVHVSASTVAGSFCAAPCLLGTKEGRKTGLLLPTFFVSADASLPNKDGRAGISLLGGAAAVVRLVSLLDEQMSTDLELGVVDVDLLQLGLLQTQDIDAVLRHQVGEGLGGVLEDGAEAGHVPAAYFEGAASALPCGGGTIPKLGDGRPFGLALVIGGGGLLLFLGRLGLGGIGRRHLLGGGGSFGLGIRGSLALAGGHGSCCFGVMRLQSLNELRLSTANRQAKITQPIPEFWYAQGAEVLSFAGGGESSTCIMCCTGKSSDREGTVSTCRPQQGEYGWLRKC